MLKSSSSNILNLWNTAEDISKHIRKLKCFKESSKFPLLINMISIIDDNLLLSVEKLWVSLGAGQLFHHTHLGQTF